MNLVSIALVPDASHEKINAQYPNANSSDKTSATYGSASCGADLRTSSRNLALAQKKSDFAGELLTLRTLIRKQRMTATNASTYIFPSFFLFFAQVSVTRATSLPPSPSPAPD